MNKNGFTLVELLATIVIIGLLAGIATISYTAIIGQTADEVFKRYEDTMHAEAVYKMTNTTNPSYYGDVNFINNKVVLKIKLTAAEESNNTDNIALLKIDPINNPKKASDKCLGSYVEVTRSRDSSSGVLTMSYKVCLICDDYSTVTKNSNGTTTPCKVYEN